MTDRASTGAPVAFISSTSEDLGPFRQKARDAALVAGFFPRMMEYFAAGGNPPLEECLRRISEDPPARLLIVLVAHRYGWVPEDQPQDEHRSITWLECLEAVERDLEILAFLVDDECHWPEELKEENRIAAAVREGKATPELLMGVQKNVEKLREFKSWLGQGRVRATFCTPQDLHSEILAALQAWRKRHPGVKVESAGDPSAYLRSLYEETGSIDIRGLQVGSGRAASIPIEDLYIPLRTISRSETEEGGKPRGPVEERHVELSRALKHDRLVIVGDPGAGKTTFLRLLAHLLCRTLLGDDPEAVQRSGLKKPLFPILIRLSEFEQHRAACRERREGPAVVNSPDWLLHYLASQWKEAAGGLDERFFRKQLQQGGLLMLDGLDEASDPRQRKSLRQWIEKTAARWQETRIVVTSRPAAYRGEAVLAGFAHSEIDSLQDDAIEAFLIRWCQALFPAGSARASKHQAELLEALRARVEIRRMARNPVMLTALAVVHWNEKRLPEQRAELYESILTWLARSREEREDRPKAERCLELLQELALAMTNQPDGRKVQVPQHWAAEAIATRWRDLPESERVRAAQTFLEQEELDSGIVVARGRELRFWHLTFQEYLAASAIAGRADAQQHRILLERLYDPEWREVVQLLAGVLHGQGVDKVDAAVTAALDQLGKRASLAERSRCAGVLGGILRDLKPLKYQPADPRYQELLEGVMGIFDREASRSIPIEEAIEAAEALGQAGDPRFTAEHRAENWVEIPYGEFWMGTQKDDPGERNYDEERGDAEGPVHGVRLGAYRIGRYPVTVGEYREFVEAGGYQEKEWWEAGGFGESEEPGSWEEQQEHPTRPVVEVSWYEAAAYAAWAGCRLPTEAEWERAARGLKGRKYPWGDEQAEAGLLNFEGNVGRPTPVGVYPRGATPEGIQDLAGNVDEWCRDWFGSYPSEEVENPTGPETEGGRVLRGGSWLNVAWVCRGAYRLDLLPSSRDVAVGFRVVAGAAASRT